MKTRGFTLIELLLVLAVMGILVSLAVPGYRAIVYRSRAAEPRLMLPVIANAELGYFRDHGKFLAADFTTAEVPKVPVAFDGTRPGWKQLGVRADGPVRYRYQVVLEGTSFKVLASGDLDGDGVASRFELNGSNLGISATDELE